MSKYYPNKHRPQSGIGKSHAIARQAITDCYKRLGGVEGLWMWATESPSNKSAFYTILLPKLIPAEIADQHGVSGGKIQVVILPAESADTKVIESSAKPLETIGQADEAGGTCRQAGVALREPEA